MCGRWSHNETCMTSTAGTTRPGFSFAPSQLRELKAEELHRTFGHGKKSLPCTRNATPNNAQVSILSIGWIDVGQPETLYQAGSLAPVAEVHGMNLTAAPKEDKESLLLLIDMQACYACAVV